MIVRIRSPRLNFVCRWTAEGLRRILCSQASRPLAVVQSLLLHNVSDWLVTKHVGVPTQ